MVRPAYEAWGSASSCSVGGTVAHAGRFSRRLQLPGGVLSGVPEQSQHPSSGRVSDVPASDGVEGPVDLWRQLRRTDAGCGLKSRPALKIQPPCGAAFLSSGGLSCGRLSSDPEGLHGVLRDHPVGGDEDHVLQVGLGNQQPIEEIAMMLREPENCQGMLVGNRKGAEALICHPPWHKK